MQYIYLIRCQNYYKIGIANDVESRLAQLSTGNPYPLEVINVYGFTNAQPVEAALHQRFSASRIRGEWFDLTPNDVLVFGDVCNMLMGQSQEVGHVDEEEIEEAEEIQETAELDKWDFASMFSDGWCIEPSNSKGKKYYWVWRKRRDGMKGYIYGGRIVDLPYPLDEMRRIFRGALKDEVK